LSRPWSTLLVAGLMAALALACAGSPSSEDAPPAEAATEAPAEPPEIGLVLILVVDQLRPDRISAELPGGLGRLVREGRSFTRGALEHARTETCPGHASILMGRHPGPAGVPGNQFIDRESLELVYCVMDASPEAGILGREGDWDPQSGRSPSRMRAGTLGDWMKAHAPATRVFTVSGKDRSAIALGGKKADVAWWLDRGGSGGFTTSHYYRSELPDWLSSWTAEKLLADVPAQWSHPTGDPGNGARRDDYPAESEVFSRVSPHPVNVGGDLPQSMMPFMVSPHLDARTLDFTRQLVEEEGLGTGPATDLLAIGLSGTDYIGHFYGPWSQESRDSLLKLDADVGAFLGFLDQRVGQGRVLIVLTSDHGVLPLPEWVIEAKTGDGNCPATGGRIMPELLESGLTSQLHAVFGRRGEEPVRWFVRDGYNFVFDPAAAASRGASVEKVIAQARGYLEALRTVERVWDAEDIGSGRGPEPLATLYRNSLDMSNPPDLVIQPVRGCLLSPYPHGTSHGSPYAYDRAVPIVFSGPGITPGASDERAATVDVAPTLAERLGVPAPQGLAGRVLELSPQ